MPYPVSLLLALLLTEAIEIAVCLLWGMRGKELWITVLANVLTNPAVNVLYLLARLYMRLPQAAVIAALEASAVVVEWLVYRALTGTKRPFLVSLSANAASYGAGLLLSVLL